jgi:two-component system sensor histidine kinase KdpD
VLVGARWTGYAAALLLTAVLTVLIGQGLGLLEIGNIAMVYLLAVLAVAVAFGIGPAIVASVAAFVTFDWFFIEPLHTWAIADPAEWLALTIFLATAVTTGALAGELRRRARVAEQREREAAVLYDVVRLLGEVDLGQALRAVAERLRRDLNVEAVGLDVVEAGKPPIRIVAGEADSFPLPEAPPLETAAVLIRGAAPTGDQPGEPGRWIRVVPPHRRLKGGTAGDRHVHTVPLESQNQRVGSLSLVHRIDAYEFSPADNRLLVAVAGQIGLALERRRLRQEVTSAEILRHTDALKTALLNAVSHDLRTPLASIMASAGALLQRDVEWSEAERGEFAEAIDQEAKRLNRLVGNLLDLSRIEAGNLLIEKGWYDLGVLVDEVLGRLRPITRGHRVVVRIPEGLAPLQLGYVEIDQVLSNLIENATKYAPAGTEISISARTEGKEVRVEVADQGPGVPAGDLPRLFDPFYRSKAEGPRPGGSGLGLGVAKGLVEAHGGRIWAENRREGGALFVFTLPVMEAGKTAEAEVSRG